jgi:hypothetical protein
MRNPQKLIHPSTDLITIPVLPLFLFMMLFSELCLSKAAATTTQVIKTSQAPSETPSITVPITTIKTSNKKQIKQ